MKPKIIFFVPGAFSGQESFNFIRQNLAISFTEPVVTFSYDITEEPLETIVTRLVKETQKIDKEKYDVVIIGHSYGGLIGRLACLQFASARELITINSPHHGFPAYSYNSFLFPISNMMFYQNTNEYNELIKFNGRCSLPEGIRHLNITGDRGVDSWFFNTNENDTVVPCKSQTLVTNRVHWYSCEEWFEKSCPVHDLVEICFHLNHFEVLLAENVCKSIGIFLGV